LAERRPYAVLDQPSRLLKAEKIARIVGGRQTLVGTRLLDIGCGSGHIAAALAELVGPDGTVDAVDVRDQRLVHEGYTFHQVEGTTLPLPDQSLDIVISNHVIEHVGEETDQLRHLTEIRRVLRPGGRCYLAVPSKWVLVEPHVGIPLLSWLPRRLQSPIVRLAGKGEFYDCEIPTRRRLRRLFAAAGLEWTDKTLATLYEVGQLEQPSRAVSLALKAPAWLQRALLPVSPTFVYLLRRPL
jgi:SAM-dependent methyltransferase